MTVLGDGDAVSSSSVGQRRRRPEPSPTQRALSLLTRREHSRQELTRKLAMRGVDATAAQLVIDKLNEAGWQSDARFAESLLRSRSGSGYGPAYIRAELTTHGLESALIADTMERFAGDWVELAQDLLRRRYPQALAADPGVQRKAADFLLRRGFGMAHVRAAMKGE